MHFRPANTCIYGISNQGGRGEKGGRGEGGNGGRREWEGGRKEGGAEGGNGEGEKGGRGKEGMGRGEKGEKGERHFTGHGLRGTSLVSGNHFRCKSEGLHVECTPTICVWEFSPYMAV